MKNIKLILIVFVLLISNTYAQYVQTNEGMYIVNNGIFESGDLSSETKTIKFKSNSNSCIEIEFETFDIGISAELKVYAGTEFDGSYLVGTYSGNNMPDNFVGSNFIFEYVAPIIYTGSIYGWKAKIKTVNCNISNLRGVNSASNSDCVSALELCNNGDILPTGQYNDNGSVNDEDGSCFTGTGQLQSAWFQFTPQTSGNLTFEIAPQAGSTDYDFVLYDITNGCASKSEMSCNFSAASGSTGLTSSSSSWQNSYEFPNDDCNGGSGNIDDYDNADEDCGKWNKQEYLTSGRTYALMVNLYGGSSDFALTWGGVQIGDTDSPFATNANTTTCAGSVLQVDLNESVPCTEVQSGDFTISGYTFTINNLHCDADGNTNQIDLNVSPSLADGSYTLLMSGIDDICGNTANDSYNFTINLHPNQYTVTGGGEYCQGTGGVAIGLSNSENGITYTLNLNGTAIGTTSNGTGNALNFGNITAAGTYTVTADNGCPIDMNGNTSVTINANPSITASVNPLAVCDGISVNLTSIATGGSSTYSTYTWNAGNGQNIAVVPSPGAFSGGQATVAYTVTVTDSKGCVASDNVDVTVYENPTPTITGNTAYCENFSTIIDAGSGYSNYNWTGGTANQTLTINSPGTYTVTVTDANSCVGTDDILISETPAPTAIISGGGTICADGSTTDIIINFTGSANWTYEWALNGTSQGNVTSSTPTQTIPSSIAGDYTVISVTDNTGCTNTASGTVTITVNALPTPVISGNIEYCAGLSTTLDVGTSYNSQIWTDGSVDHELVVSQPGTYSVTVTDVNNCENSTSVDIAENTLPVAVAGTDKEICNGETINVDANGSSAVTPAAIVNYTWNIGAGVIQSVSPIITTSYIVTVVDDNGCVDSDTIQVEVHQLPTANAGSNNEICNGETYTIDASTSTAVSPATITNYNWNNSVSGASQDVTPTTTQTYQVTVIDNFQCEAVNSVTITVNQLPVLSVDATSPVTNCNVPNGELQISASGTNPSFLYNINGSTFGSVTQWDTLNSLQYHIGIQDSKMCENYINVIIDNTSGLAIDSVLFDNILCFGDTTSTIEIYSAGTNLSYSIDDGASVIVSNTFANNGAGVYFISIIDNVSSCIATQGLTIPEPTQLVNTFTTYDILCFGDSTSLHANISGGTSNYTINWSTGNQTDSISGLIANNYYSINIIDANACELNDSVMYTQPTQLLIDTILNKQLMCNGDKGEISIGVIGGITNYTFNWNLSLVHDSIIYNLDAGEYVVTVIDNNNCEVTDVIHVIEPDLLVLAPFSNSTLCETNNGMAGVSVNGGTVSYSYSWSHNASLQTDTANALTAGNYSLTVTDNNACADSVSFVIADQSSGIAQVVSTPTILCYGNANGQIIASVNGGQPNYTYQWFNSSNLIQETVTNNNFDTLNNVSAGSYIISITDSLGCISIIDTIIITQPDSIIVNYTNTNIMCFGDNNGVINTMVQGGITPLTYNWSNSENTDTLNNLLAGIYYLTVVDANNCKDSSLVIEIAEPTELNVNIGEIINPTCNGLNNGSIDIEITGGVENYSINWDGIDDNSENLSNIEAGSYAVYVTDANGCKKDTTVIITQPQPILILDTNYVNNYVGYIDVAVLGGTPEYYYSWSNGEYSNTIENLSTGEYIVTVTDINNCSSIDTVYIEIPLLIPSVITPNNDGKNDTWQVSGVSQYEKITINIFNRWGDVVYSYSSSGIDYSLNIEKQWNGEFSGKMLPLGTYVYILNINDINKVYKGTVTIVR